MYVKKLSFNSTEILFLLVLLKNEIQSEFLNSIYPN